MYRDLLRHGCSSPVGRMYVYKYVSQRVPTTLVLHPCICVVHISPLTRVYPSLHARARLVIDGMHSSAEVANGQTWTTRVLRIRLGFRCERCAPGMITARRPLVYTERYDHVGDNSVPFWPPKLAPAEYRHTFSLVGRRARTRYALPNRLLGPVIEWTTRVQSRPGKISSKVEILIFRGREYSKSRKTREEKYLNPARIREYISAHRGRENARTLKI